MLLCCYVLSSSGAYASSYIAWGNRYPWYATTHKQYTTNPHTYHNIPSILTQIQHNNLISFRVRGTLIFRLRASKKYNVFSTGFRYSLGLIFKLTFYWRKLCRLRKTLRMDSKQRNVWIYFMKNVIEKGIGASPRRESYDNVRRWSRDRLPDGAYIESPQWDDPRWWLANTL